MALPIGSAGINLNRDQLKTLFTNTKRDLEIELQELFLDPETNNYEIQSVLTEIDYCVNFLNTIENMNGQHPPQNTNVPNINTTNQNILATLNILNQFINDISIADNYDSDELENQELENQELDEFLQPVPVPVPEEIMDKLHIKTYDKKMGYDQCSICFEKFLDTNIIKSRVRELICGHIYHMECIDKWLKEKPTCPICKHDQRGGGET